MQKPEIVLRLSGITSHAEYFKMLNKTLRLWLTLLVLATTCHDAFSDPMETRRILVEDFHYPRVVRLDHSATPLVKPLIASTNGIILRSNDEGENWTQISTVPKPAGSPFRCCSSLYELPSALGRLSPGTLLSAATVREGAIFEIALYTSSDQGRTWAFAGIPVRGGATGGGGRRGVWEPEFTIGKDGALVMFWSDETDPCCSQKISQMRTYDGITWSDRRDTLASSVSATGPA